MALNEGGDAVQRLYERLTAALRSSRSEPFAAPVTVAEIYQELVPYRMLRGEAGFAMNADYEHALLRLLGGEDELVTLEPPGARDVILRELRSANPNVTIYREYAACDAWVRPLEEWVLDALDEEEDDAGEGAGVDAVMPAPPGGASGPVTPAPPGGPSDAEGRTDAAGARGAAPPQATPTATFALADPAAEPATDHGRRTPAEPAAQGGARTSPDREAAPAGGPPDVGAEAAARRPAAGAASPASAVGGRCVFCDSGLPQGRAIRFCPWCGGDQQMRPCGACGEALEAGWSFCVACGSQADGG
jgi:hypothetical protein